MIFGRKKKRWQDKYFNDMLAVSESTRWLVDQIENQGKIDKVDLHNFIVGNMNEYPKNACIKYQSSTSTTRNLK